MKKILLLVAGGLSFAAFQSCKNEPAASHMPIDTVLGIDSSIKPGDNFFMFVNGKWYDTVSIPQSQAGVGSYSFMNYPQRQRLETILDSVSKASNKPGSIEQQLGDFYASGMDTATIEKLGYTPLKPLLNKIDAIKDQSSLLQFVAEAQKDNNGSIMGIYVGPDDKNSKINILHFSQTGLGLPDRDYYFKTDAPTLTVQAAYKQFITSLFSLTGADAATAKQQTDIVYGIEKQLAESHKTNIERRDVKANYNKMSLAAINTKTPNIGWSNYLKTLGLQADSADIQQPAYYEKLNKMLAAVTINDWKLYLKANVLSNYATALSKPFSDAAFDYSKVLTGQATRKPRAEEMVEVIDQNLGQALGQLYVKKYFSEEAKKRINELVDNLEKAYAHRIDKLDWMSDSTKAAAKEKLKAFSRKVGYPDKWRSYEKVKVGRNSYFENMVSAARNDFEYGISKLGQPVDNTEWHTTPGTVTAYNNPPLNEIVFPAGILQYPYFDISSDDATNYGGIGMVIGHEITHSFDDQGAQFDKDGNVRNWWTPDDYAKFKAKTQQVIDLYSTFTVLDTVHVKGALTVGENTADNGGIAIAYDAFKLTKQGQDSTRIDGFTPDQRFFLSIARIWRVKTRDAFMRNYVNTNSHSPAIWRVNGPLMNFGPFYKAFNVQPGDKMYRAEDQRLKIW
ncbi:MAG TPA: M13 family metallopeptidase [Flavihumibacter sp.]|nr:M13 family metallopeptidase [Flavihumibacter sp.]